MLLVHTLEKGDMDDLVYIQQNIVDCCRNKYVESTNIRCWVHGVAAVSVPDNMDVVKDIDSMEKEAGQLFNAVKPEHAESILSVSAVKMRLLVFDRLRRIGHSRICDLQPPPHSPTPTRGHHIPGFAPPIPEHGEPILGLVSLRGP